MHEPQMPWCDICIRARGRDACHRAVALELWPVKQFDCAEARTEQGQPHFEFMFGVDTSIVSAWASAVLDKGKENLHISTSILSWLAELGHWKEMTRSDKAPAAEAVMRLLKWKGDLMVTPPCEIIQEQSQRNSHEGNGGAERMVLTIRNQIMACKIQIETDAEITIGAESHLLTWFPRHVAWQHTRFVPVLQHDNLPRDPTRQVPIPNLVGWQRLGVLEVKIGLRGLMVSGWVATADQTITRSEHPPAWYTVELYDDEWKAIDGTVNC